MVDRNLSVPGLFDAALELPADQRASFLDQACRGDPDLREQVEALLGFLDDARTRDLFPALPGDTPRPLALGDRIGPYRVLRQLGAGGMGVVFLAEREDVEKRVAVKLIREGGLASGDRLRRFLLERRVLARLEHPNIARLLDAGVTEYRLPYFAMEYVEGTPIDRYCDERRLSLSDRMQLFRTVCHAVHHAHQNLIVHRDLKPSNILVTGDGQVKLLDFGIAKLLADQASPDPAEANTGLLLLTPEYASPEQVSGGAVTTSSDIYSLGVVLYQLLTGHRPYRLASRTSAEAERVVCQVVPERPSVVIARAPVALSLAELPVASTPGMIAQARGSTPERLQRQLRGDLDTIVLKALSKEPGRRYLSAAQLSDDLRRHLDGLPVLARRDTAGYRAGKFLRRHRLGVAAVVLLLVTLLAGVVATAWQARRAEAQRIVAEARFRDVHALATTVLFDIHDAVAHLPGATRARALIVNRGLEYLQRLSAQSRGDRTLQRESAEAYIRLGMAQGYPSGANLGDLAAARVSMGKALMLAMALVASDSKDLRARRTLALVHEKLGDVKAWSGDVAGAVEHAREALSHWVHLADMQPENPAARLSVAISMTKLGDLLGHPAFPNLGDRAGAESHYRRSLDLLEQPGLDSAGSGRRRHIALTHERLGAMLRLAGRQEEALAALERSLALREALYREDRTAMDAARDVAVSREVLCRIQLARRDPATAMSHCEAAVALYQDLRDADPGNAQGLTDLAIAESGLSQALAARGRWSAALERLARSSGMLREFLKTDSTNLRAGRELARNLLHASMLHVRLSAGAAGGERERHLERAGALYASGREALTGSIARATTVEDEADERLAGEAAERLALVEAARPGGSQATHLRTGARAPGQPPE